MKKYIILIVFVFTNILLLGQSKFHFEKCIFNVDTNQIIKISDSYNLSLMITKIHKTSFPKILNLTYNKVIISPKDCSLSFDFKKDSFYYSVCIFRIINQERLNYLNKLNLKKRSLISPSILTFEYQIKNKYLCIIYTAVRSQNLFLNDFIKNISLQFDK